ncbi:hypothetical protein BWQ96_09897 [Gracilariopsis chorda]|uniref:Uncharacterized protein n=1 Tax=Gracilariopsis chorda TaxID=448386 RepID=A0A2V3IGW9_9FLOR|nr:hypothetical protein BWQ96_09897 [Gracilariopsis chorda]|eukprot:PXF40390.1 hypothetical protein BWQ96_09897 [Gracilariopsis chorda]
MAKFLDDTVNLGSRCEAIGPFEAEPDLIEYHNPQPGLFSNPSLRVNGTKFDHAYVTQRMNRLISFVVKVDKRFNYRVTLGFAEVNKDTCKPGARVMNLNVQGTPKVGVDVFRAVGCRNPDHITFENVKPGRLGFLSGFVRGIKNMANVATICIERVTRDAQPPHRLPSPRTVLKESQCRQKDCFTFDGPGDYVLIGNSLSRSEDRRNCQHRKSSSARLKLPTGAKVKKAILYWSASGRLRQKAKASFNGVIVLANRTYYGGYTTSLRFYGAWAGVTSMVQTNRLYNVGGIWVDNGEPYCSINSAYAVWSLAVVSERANLPSVRLSLCVDDFTYTYPAGIGRLLKSQIAKSAHSNSLIQSFSVHSKCESRRCLRPVRAVPQNAAFALLAPNRLPKPECRQTRARNCLLDLTQPNHSTHSERSERFLP